MRPPPADWREARERFIDDVEFRGRADETLRMYDDLVGQFTGYLGDIKHPVGQMDVDTVESFLKFRRASARMGPKTAGATMNKWVRCLSAFLSYLWDHEWLDKPLRRVPRFTEEKRITPVPSPEALQKLTEAVRNSSVILPPDEMHHLADLKGVLDNTGFRFREAHHLRVSDCDMVSDPPLLYVLSHPDRKLKDHQERVVRMNDACREIIARRILMVGRRPEARLFPNFSKSRKRVLDAFKQAAASIGLGGRITFHMLRGAFTTHNVDVFNEVELMLQMGWCTIDVAREHYHRALQVRLPIPKNVPATPAQQRHEPALV